MKKISKYIFILLFVFLIVSSFTKDTKAVSCLCGCSKYVTKNVYTYYTKTWTSCTHKTVKVCRHLGISTVICTNKDVKTCKTYSTKVKKFLFSYQVCAECYACQNSDPVTSLKCSDGILIWDSSVGSYGCASSQTYSNGKCPAGTYVGTLNDGTKTCIKYGTFSNSGTTGSLCKETDSNCNASNNCASAGLSPTNTGGHALIGIAECSARIDCSDVTKTATCYESSRTDNRNVQFKMGSKASKKIKQTGKTANLLLEFLNSITPDIFAADNEIYTTTTKLGFSNDSASGIELNNPVRVEAEYSDEDGVNDLEALFFWMTKEGTEVESSPRYIDTDGSVLKAKTVSNSDFGFMIRRIGDNWDKADIYVPEITQAGNYWVKIDAFGSSRFYIYGPEGLPMVSVSNLNSSISGNSIMLTFNITFLNQTSGLTSYEKVYEGSYDLLGMSLDEYSFLAWDNYSFSDDKFDLEKIRNEYFSENEIRDYDSWIDMNINWTVDLTPPEIENLRVSIADNTNLHVDWTASDTQTNLSYSVGNVFYDQESHSIVNYLGPSTSQLYTPSTFDENIIGLISGNNLWSDSLNDSILIRTDSLDINGIDNGILIFYVTVFDQAGNYDVQSKSFNLGAWMVTRGGILFSEGGTNVPVRLLDANSDQWPEDLWYSTDDTHPPVFDPALADLSTEILAGNVIYKEDLYTLIHSSEKQKGDPYNESSIVTQNSGLFKNNAYLSLKQKVLQQISLNSSEIYQSPPSSNVFVKQSSNYCNSDYPYCTIILDSDIVISSGFSCDINTLFITSGNIYIKPNVTNANAKSSCLFVSGNNIIFEEGAYASEDFITPKYDIVEGYFIADGIIQIESGNDDKLLKDGLQINGGLVAFGTDKIHGSSIVIERRMKLMDRIRYPILAIQADSKYGKIALKFFGSDTTVYKREVGYKPY